MTRRVPYPILHETEYAPCGVPVSLAQHLLHLIPRELPWQTRESGTITIEPDLAQHAEGEDAFGNPVAWLSLDVPHDGLLLRAESHVTVIGRPLPKAEDSPEWEDVRDSLRYRPEPRDADTLDALRYLYASPRVPRDAQLAEFARAAFMPEPS